ncbi:unnamed protein product [Oncorhynchus mykiss]|uniref:Reverse transcriptase domain-containing protein n=1 Tax=Oncorhynchus mykiss TaxID=8022 RepID=A0A060YX79_ONCMY|nr:unnamed protein product [Oncorhynchus mykiss]
MLFNRSLPAPARPSSITTLDGSDLEYVDNYKYLGVWLDCKLSFQTHMDKGGVVGAVFLDLRKAFDTVNHEILITKLSKFNFSPDALRWMKSYLEGRAQCVRVSNELSPTLSYDVGVPQRSILGPSCSACTLMICLLSVLGLKLKCMQMIQ